MERRMWWGSVVPGKITWFRTLGNSFSCPNVLIYSARSEALSYYHHHFHHSLKTVILIVISYRVTRRWIQRFPTEYYYHTTFVTVLATILTIILIHFGVLSWFLPPTITCIESSAASIFLSPWRSCTSTAHPSSIPPHYQVFGLAKSILFQDTRRRRRPPDLMAALSIRDGISLSIHVWASL